MNGHINYHDIPLSSLSYKFRILLSSLLNTKKVIPSENTDKLPRDWQGLAALVNIPSETLSDNALCADKTAKVLEIWQEKKDGTATLATLLLYLQKIDRYDICDDLQELGRQGLLIDQDPQDVERPINIPVLNDPGDMITKDDVIHRAPQSYHAYVLFAKEDRLFAEELLSRMRKLGFKLCTEDDLLPGFYSRYDPISRLISQRCYRIILIYSPDFFKSPDNNFFMQYVQADGINSMRIKILPCMYRPCKLPPIIQHYHNLYYSPPGQRQTYDFWQRLSISLQVSHITCSNDPTSRSMLQITELTPSPTISLLDQNLGKDLLALPPTVITKSYSNPSISTQQTSESRLLSNSGEISDSQFYFKIKKFFTKPFKGKKNKNKLALSVS